MTTLSELHARYDGPIPKGLVIETGQTLREQLDAMTDDERLEWGIRQEMAALSLNWSDIRRLCRYRDGVLVGLIEAGKLWREKRDAYYLNRWKMLREDLTRLLRQRERHQERLATLIQKHDERKAA